MAVISFASSKGGAGKTTACIVLGTELAQHTTVTMIDADPAQRLIAWSRRAALPPRIRVTGCTEVREVGEVIKSEQGHSTVVLVDLEGIASRLNTAVIARSNMVIIPMGDEQQDATAAVDTLREIRADEETLGRQIKARVLFSRTKAAVKSRIAKLMNEGMRANVPCFEVELKDRSAYSHLHNTGGGLRDLPDGVGGLEKAIQNAEEFAAEVYAVLMEDAQ
ncbi:MAG: ParA family protein [Rhodobacterales bacterium]|nr:ParA family protein [Rhodobacterales bacterium]